MHGRVAEAITGAKNAADLEKALGAIDPLDIAAEIDLEFKMDLCALEKP